MVQYHVLMFFIKSKEKREKSHISIGAKKLYLESFKKKH